MHRVARRGASHETPSALEPASYARAGEARLVERDLGEDAFVVTFHERKRELRRVVVVEAVRRLLRDGTTGNGMIPHYRALLSLRDGTTRDMG